MSRPIEAPVRWSIHNASLEFGHSTATIKSGLRANNIAPGADKKFSTREICAALYGDHSALEKRAKAAVFQRKIADAEYAQMKRDELSGKLVLVGSVKEWLLDYTTKVVQTIRHSTLSSKAKDQLLSEIREASFGNLTFDERRELAARNEQREKAEPQQRRIELETLRRDNARLRAKDRQQTVFWDSPDLSRCRIDGKTYVEKKK
jgi:hypothetical protein